LRASPIIDATAQTMAWRPDDALAVAGVEHAALDDQLLAAGADARRGLRGDQLAQLGEGARRPGSGRVSVVGPMRASTPRIGDLALAMRSAVDGRGGVVGGVGIGGTDGGP
jgi:hypothetical protein